MKRTRTGTIVAAGRQRTPVQHGGPTACFTSEVVACRAYAERADDQAFARIRLQPCALLLDAGHVLRRFFTIQVANEHPCDEVTPRRESLTQRLRVVQQIVERVAHLVVRVER